MTLALKYSDLDTANMQKIQSEILGEAEPGADVEAEPSDPPTSENFYKTLPLQHFLKGQ